MPDQKLKIGFVLDDTLDTPDGVQQYVLTVGSWLTKQGHEVHYLVGESNRQDIENIHSMARNVKVRFNQNRLSIPLPTRRSEIIRKLAELKLDVLHVQMPYSPLFAGRVVSAAPQATKVVGTFHIVPASWLHSAGARSLELVNRRTLKRFHSVISVSPAAASFAKTVFGIDSVIIPNAVTVKKMRHEPIVEKTPHIVFLGRLVERKGCQYLLAALVQLQRQYKGAFKVTIAGKGPLLAKLKQYADKQNLKQVSFSGFIEESDKPALLASADIAVFPSTGGESFGIVLIEAMAAGSRVVLGGNNVGYQSVLSDHPDLLVDVQNAKTFANRLQYFLEHPSAREAAARWAKIAIKQYDVDVVGKKLLEQYYG
jgi:phosphatidylinositol alpha-mannosyltransferase